MQQRKVLVEIIRVRVVVERNIKIVVGDKYEYLFTL